MKIYHVDVFSNKALAGNGLTVVFPEKEMETGEMQKIAQEFKQFETIFLWQQTENHFKARIFTVEEELDFAGHPILGAAAVIHEQFSDVAGQEIVFQLNQKTVTTSSKKQEQYYEVVMNQGKAEWGKKISDAYKRIYCEKLNITEDSLCEEYPMEIVSTGLPYLLVPIRKGLQDVKIKGNQFEKLLEENGAKFVYVFDMNRMEGRTWDNLGLVEDVATGSAAGPMGAYLFQHGCVKLGEEVQIHQGGYVGRPSVLKVRYRQETGDICVAGDVKILMMGELQIS